MTTDRLHDDLGLDVWGPPAPPAGLADAVIARVGFDEPMPVHVPAVAVDPRTGRARHRAGWFTAGALFTAAAVGAAAFALHTSRPVEPSMTVIATRVPAAVLSVAAAALLGVATGGSTVDVMPPTVSVGSAMTIHADPSEPMFARALSAPPQRGFLAAEIDAVFRAHGGLFRACYQRGLNGAPTLAGKIVVELTINDAGGVAVGRIGASSTVHDDDVRDCVAAIVATLQFPAGRGTANVRYPLVFSSGSSAIGVSGAALAPPPPPPRTDSLAAVEPAVKACIAHAREPVTADAVNIMVTELGHVIDSIEITPDLGDHADVVRCIDAIIRPLHLSGSGGRHWRMSLQLAAQVAAAHKTSQLRGVVHAQASGRQLAGATIIVTPGNVRLTTLGDGSFELDVAPGVYTLVVSAPGFGTASINATAEDNDVTLKDIDLPAPAAAAVTIP